MKVGRNTPCPCGSGKKYKKCCLNKEQKPLRSSHYLTLHDRTKILYNGMLDIFGISKAKEWLDVKRAITADRVKEFYKLYAWLWKPDTDISLLFPKPDGKLRSLYIGRYRPELILRNIVRYTLYTDEILVILPFTNPWCVRKEFNPIENPDKFRQETLRTIAMLHQLGPWVFAGLVKLIPDPGDFDYNLRISTWNMAKERVKNRKITDKDFEDDMKYAKEDFERELLRMPKDSLIRLIKKWDPKISDSKLEDMIKYVEKKKRIDPLMLEDEPKPGESSFLIARTGTNLEMGLYISQLTGAYMYTDIKFRWEEILSVAKTQKGQGELWAPLTKAFQELRFKFLNNVDPRFACEFRKDGRLESFRNFLRKVWTSIGGEPEPSKINDIARNFSDELRDEYNKAEADWKKIDQALAKWTLSSGGVAAILTGGMQWQIPALGFCITAIGELLAAKYKRDRFRKTVPLSVFLDLESKK